MEFSDFDKQCLELLKASPNRQSRHCFRSAVNYLHRAERLFPIDNPMAVFCCYTAAEEAASGLMYCLKDKGYKNAEKLRPKDHFHKNAVVQFFPILYQFFWDNFEQHGAEFYLSLQKNNDKKWIRLEAQVPIDGQLIKFIPDPPLNFQLIHQGKKISYKKQLDQYVQSHGAKNVTKHLKELTNQRNRTLYASAHGYPKSISIELPAHQRIVTHLTRAYLLIHPYEVQPFVQDALDAFLQILGKIDADHLHNEL